MLLKWRSATVPEVIDVDCQVSFHPFDKLGDFEVSPPRIPSIPSNTPSHSPPRGQQGQNEDHIWNHDHLFFLYTVYRSILNCAFGLFAENLKMVKLNDLTKHLNFFRYHLLFFTFTPIIVSGIFYGANGKAPHDGSTADVQKVDYIDSLFLCYSAMT